MAKQTNKRVSIDVGVLESVAARLSLVLVVLAGVELAEAADQLQQRGQVPKHGQHLLQLRLGLDAHDAAAGQRGQRLQRRRAPLKRLVLLRQTK